MGKRRHCRGFSLLELVVVLVIGALIAGLVAVRISAVHGNVSVQREAQRLAALLRQARNEALVRHEPTAVKLLRLSSAPDTATSEHAFQARAGVALDYREGSRSWVTKDQTLRFFPDGTSTGGEVTLSADVYRYVVRVDWLTGRVTIRDGRANRGP